MSRRTIHSVYLILSLFYLVLAPCSAFSFCNPSLRKNISLTADAKRTRLSSSKIDESIDDTRVKRKLNGKLPILSRNVPIHTEEIPFVTIWELENPSKLIEMWWQADIDGTVAIDKEKIGDPFGVVMWPGSILASQELVKHQFEVQNRTVLILGAGTGVEAQVAAKLGASKVIAVDVNNLTLKLLKYGAESADLGHIIEARAFDLFSDEKLPKCDIVVAADVLYNERLASQIGIRCVEVLKQLPAPAKLIVTDSQKFHGTDFLESINTKEDLLPLSWTQQRLRVQGSGVVIEGDQEYDADIRMLSVGWWNNS